MLQMRVLGGLQVMVAGQPLVHFMSSKVPALLAYLAVTQRPHSRDSLATLLWGDLGEADAKNNLRQALSNLRKFVDPHLLISRDTVEFNAAAPHLLDSADFLRLLYAAPAQEATAQRDSYQRAADLYQGDFLAGFLVRQAPEFEAWASHERERFHTLAVQALHILTNGFLTQGHYAAAIESAGRLLRLDDEREEAHMQLIMALARDGQRTTALHHYQQWRDRLQTGFGAAPAAELTLLAARVRAAQGQRRDSLPAATTPLLECTNEVAEVRRLLADASCRLLTLTGPGGVGKSRLALEVGHQMQAAFLNGVAFVPLAGVSPDRQDGVLFAMIDALGLTLTGATRPLDQLTQALRAQERLLVLDNAEHLLDQIGWLGDLLHAARDLKILVTSQERLALSGEWVVEVESLPIPPTPDVTAVQRGAGRLFVAAAQRGCSSFKVTADNAAAIRQICEAVGGLPLALLLAAAWVQSLSCAAIAQELTATLDFLEGRYRDMPPRQQGLRAVFSYSWQRLTPAAQRALAQLTVFPASFTPAAAHEIAGVDRATLQELVVKSLGRLTDMPDERYALPPVLRSYAAEQLAQATTLHYQARHAAYFAGWLAQLELELYTAREVEIFHAIRTDYDNIRAYWQWAVRREELLFLAEGLTTLRVFLAEQGRYQEGMGLMAETAAMLEPLAANPAGTIARSLLGRVLTAWAIFCQWGGQSAQAIPLFERAVPLLRYFGSAADMGSLYLNWGYLTVQGGDYATARTYLETSLVYHQQAEVAHGIAASRSALGALDNITGDLAQARNHLEASVAISREQGDETALRSSLTNLGNVYYLEGDRAIAKSYYLEVLPLCQKVADRSSEAVILSNLATLAQEEGDLVAAESYLQTALTLFRDMSSWHYLLHGMALLASLQRAQGNAGQARQTLRYALQQAITEQIPPVMPLLVDEIAQLYAANGALYDALEHLYWVLAHPALTDESRRTAQERRGRWEAEVGRQVAVQAGITAALLTAEAIVGRL